MTSSVIRQLQSQFSPWDALVVVTLTVFYSLTIYFHSDVLVGGLDEYYKLKFVLEMKGLSYFLPWSGNGGMFYGHPGLMNVFYYLWSLIFGNTMLSVRHFCLFFHSATLLVFYLFLKKESRDSTAFFAFLGMLSLPMFQVQSILFLNQIGSFLWVFLSLIAYQRKSWKAFSLFSLMGFLWLESSLAFVIAVVIIEILNKLRGQAFRKAAIVSSATTFLGVGLFYLAKSFSPGGDAHTTKEMVLRRVLQPWRMFTEVDYSLIFQTRAVTFLENGIAMYWLHLGALFLGVLAFRNRQPLSESMLALFFGSLGILFFGSFLSSHPGGSDTYAFFFFVFGFFFMGISGLRFSKVLVTLSVLIFFTSSVLRLSEEEESWFQTTFHEYTLQKTFENITFALEQIPRELYCHHRTGDFSPAFCHSFYGFQPRNLTNLPELDGNEVDMVMSIEDEDWFQEHLEEQHYQVVGKEPLGPVFYRHVWLYRLRKADPNP